MLKLDQWIATIIITLRGIFLLPSGLELAYVRGSGHLLRDAWEYSVPLCMCKSKKWFYRKLLITMTLKHMVMYLHHRGLVSGKHVEEFETYFYDVISGTCKYGGLWGKIHYSLVRNFSPLSPHRTVLMEMVDYEAIRDVEMVSEIQGVADDMDRIDTYLVAKGIIHNPATIRELVEAKDYSEASPLLQCNVFHFPSVDEYLEMT